jgi:hypothetical protein
MTGAWFDVYEIKASDIYYFERNSNGSLIIVCSDRKGREWI